MYAGNTEDAAMTANTLPSPGELVDEHEAAAILSTSVRTLRNWRTLRKGPRYRKIGARMVRYHRADLAEFQQVMTSVADGGSAA
jgi:predicted DNA-binding transcriptional regulator AlpA